MDVGLTLAFDARNLTDRTRIPTSDVIRINTCKQTCKAIPLCQRYPRWHASCASSGLSAEPRHARLLLQLWRVIFSRIDDCCYCDDNHLDISRSTWLSVCSILSRRVANFEQNYVCRRTIGCLTDPGAVPGSSTTRQKFRPRWSVFVCQNGIQGIYHRKTTTCEQWLFSKVEFFACSFYFWPPNQFG